MALEDDGRLAQARVVQLVRLLLEPFEAAGGAEDAEMQAMDGAGAGLGHPHHAGRAALQLEQHARIVVGVAAGHDRAHVGADTGELLPVTKQAM